MIMVYLILSGFTANKQPAYDKFTKALESLKATPVMVRDAWLVVSDKTATQLYLELLAPLGEEDSASAKLFVAEITPNSIGTYIQLPTTHAILATIIAKARDD